MQPSRVADILMEQGRQSAEAARTQGQLWGSLPGRVVEQYQQQKQQGIENKAKAARLGLDTEHLALLQQEEKDRVAAQAHTREGVALTGDLVKQNSKLDENGHYVYDHDAITNGLITAGHPEAAGHWQDLGNKLQTSLADAQTKTAAAEAAKQQARANILGTVADAPEADRAMRYGMMVNALPPGSDKDPVLGKLPPVYPGHPAFSQMYDMTQTEAQRATKAHETATQALAAKKETLAEEKATATEAETARYHREETAARGSTAAYQRGELAAASRRESETIRHNRAEEGLGGARVAAGAGGRGAVSDVQEAVASMKEGTAPPMLPGRATKEYLATIAEARRQKFDIASAATDWTATQKHIATLNGAQQTRLNQSINSLPEMLDKVDALSEKWKGGRFPVLNKANLTAAKNGLYGKDVQSVATQLDAQIADVTADLGSVYMGGNSPTDHALGLAAKALSADWSQSTLKDMTTLARNNVKIRSNSIKHTGVAGASPRNPYGTQAPDTQSGAKRIYYDAQGNPIQ